MKQPRPGGTGFVKQSEERKLTYYLELKKNPIVQVDGGGNYYPTSFKFASLVLLSKNHEKVLPGTSLFHPEASMNKPNQVKPTLLLRAVVVVSGSVAGQTTIVVGVLCLLLFYRLLLIGRILQTIGPRMLCRAVGVAVQRARSAAVALCSAS